MFGTLAIVAVSWDKKYQHARLVWHRVYQPTAQEPLDFERAIEATLLDLNKRFRVRKVWYDPYQMHATAQRLIRAGLKLEEFPQTVPNLTEASQNLFELIKGNNRAAYPACATAASPSVSLTSHSSPTVVAPSLSDMTAVRRVLLGNSNTGIGASLKRGC